MRRSVGALSLIAVVLVVVLIYARDWLVDPADVAIPARASPSSTPVIESAGESYQLPDQVAALGLENSAPLARTELIPVLQEVRGAISDDERTFPEFVPAATQISLEESAGLGDLRRLDFPLSEMYDTLVEAANRGDSRAALGLYSALSECRSFFEADALGDNVAQHVRVRLDRVCQGFTLATTRQAYRWLDLAAQLGHRKARYYFAIEATRIAGGDKEIQRNPGSWTAIRSRAGGYLLQLTSQCEEAAAYLVARHFSPAGVLFQEDMSSAMFFHSVGNEISSLRGGVVIPHAGELLSAGGVRLSEIERAARLYVSRRCQ